MKFKMQIDPSNEERKQKKLKGEELKLICKMACSLSSSFCIMLTGEAPMSSGPCNQPTLLIHNARRMYISNQHLQSVMAQSSYYIHLAGAKIIISPLQLFAAGIILLVCLLIREILMLCALSFHL
jgi:hypothetical protein